MDALLQNLLAIGREAAREIMDVYARPFAVDYKGPADPVTEADRRANTLICARLRELEPNTPIVAEESPEEDWADFRSFERVFFVDPVDGTRAFVDRTDDFVVMIGLLDGQRPTHGVLVAPVSGIAWAGALGRGAFRIDRDGSVSEVRVPETLSLADAAVVSSRSHRTSLLEQAIERLAVSRVLAIGSAGLKGAAVVDGRADIYLAPEHAGCRWDACAPEAILRAAGGTYTDALGNDLDYRAPSLKNDTGIVAGNPNLHGETVRLVAPLLQAELEKRGRV
ncbi:MAG: hypothetical protein B6A08_08645 [Sorangiineae bacterium NIC37A_2]|jgi:3'(2'), 5'-bisphosphate nucleotidase|nr:MAG: hypothetical protein B6A08_08645 [Sorangiineae bacterium NIC37A_2]